MHSTWLLTIALGLFALSAPESCAGPGDETRVFVAGSHAGRGWLGVAVEDMSDRMARRMGADVTQGALVNEVVDGSPAATAGVKADDIIVAVDDRTIADADDLVRAIRKADPETTVKLTLVRKRERLTVPVELASRGEPRRAAMSWVWPDGRATILGMSLRGIAGQLAGYFKAPGKRAVLIEEVAEGSVAASAGAQAGDVITRLGSEPVRDIDDMEWVLEDASGGETLPMVVLRNGSERTLQVTLPESFSRSGLFEDRMLHFFPPVPDAEFQRQIEIELPRQLRKERLELRGLKGPLEALKREMKTLGRQLEREVREVRESLERAVRTTLL